MEDFQFVIREDVVHEFDIFTSATVNFHSIALAYMK